MHVPSWADIIGFLHNGESRMNRTWYHFLILNHWRISYSQYFAVNHRAHTRVYLSHVRRLCQVKPVLSFSSDFFSARRSHKHSSLFCDSSLDASVWKSQAHLEPAAMSWSRSPRSHFSFEVNINRSSWPVSAWFYAVMISLLRDWLIW